MSSDDDDQELSQIQPTDTIALDNQEVDNANDYTVSERGKELAYKVFGNKEQLLSNLSEAVNETDTRKRKKRQPLWHDSDDEHEADDVIDYGKKGAPTVRKIGKYKAHLENTFQNVLGAPKWADLDRQKESDSDDDDAVIRRTVGLIKAHTSTKLPPTVLQFKRLKDVNRATYAEGPGITSTEFHPTSTAAIVTGYSGVATIYAIDGKKNEKLHSVSFENFPIKQCSLTNSGNQAIIGGSKKYFYTFDLLTGSAQRIFLPKDITKLTQFQLSPCGTYLAVVGRFGDVHILSATTKEKLFTLKQEHPCVALAFSNDSSQLFSHSSDAEVTVFNMKNRLVEHRFWDDGCINGSTITISPSGELLATGSRQGVVNIYDLRQSLTTKTPKPLKAVMNLTTAISSIKFNSTSEMLAMSSNCVADAVRMVHFPSGTVFNNFPGILSKLDKPTVLSFSPQSGYFAIGSMAKQVSLYRLKHYNNY